jgi:signal transduction histidine kinase
MRALLPAVMLLVLIEDWIFSSLLGRARPFVVLASAVTALVFLLAIGVVVARVSRVIGNAIDSAERDLRHAVSQRIQAEQQVQASYEEVRKLADQRRLLLGQIVSAQEEERARISGDLHDDPIQMMTAAGLRLETLRRSVNESLGAEVDRIQAVVATAIGRLRRLTTELHPRTLDEDGLSAALREHLAFLEEGAGIYSFENHLSREPDAEVRYVAYRIALEALTNARKHSGADRVHVSLRDAGPGFRVTISDNGVGIRPESISESAFGHIGLSSMRERAETADGWLKIGPENGQGTVVEFWLPYEASGISSDTVVPEGPATALWGKR